MIKEAALQRCIVVKAAITTVAGHTKGTEEAGGLKGSNKRKFKAGKAGKQELKSKDKILKERRRKAKIQAFQKHRQVVHSKKQANKKKR